MGNAIGWFEIGSRDTQRAQQFYGDLFGWKFARDTDVPDAEFYSIDSGEGLPGGMFGVGDRPGYAMFAVVVDDVAAACAAATEGGGKVDSGPFTTGAGLVFAYLSDPEGNRFSVFTPPARA
jgi:predicted enzyme related to lactoylglutathione lyase